MSAPCQPAPAKLLPADPDNPATAKAISEFFNTVLALAAKAHQQHGLPIIAIAAMLFGAHAVIAKAARLPPDDSGISYQAAVDEIAAWYGVATLPLATDRSTLQ